MSLDCYPLGERQSIRLEVQPMALEVIYEDDLFISTADDCQSIAIYDFNSKDGAEPKVKFSCGQDIVVDQIAHCRTGDYLAYIGHRSGSVSLYIATAWREPSKDLKIVELDIEGANRENETRFEELTGFDCCQRTGNIAVSCGDTVLIFEFVGNPDEFFRHIINVKLSFQALKISLLENYLSITAADHVQVIKLELADLNADSSSQSSDDCITWNLNTKKLVKLPALLHNTSTNLSSFHICHPLELLGPASESIACRVSASIYSPDFSRNQLETVVMLCKQFDFYRDPVKSAHLEAVYLGNQDDLRRLSKTSKDPISYESSNINADGNLNKANNTNTSSNNICHSGITAASNATASGTTNGTTTTTTASAEFSACDPQIDVMESSRSSNLLKSKSNDLLASVTCIVSTLTHCFVYNLNGKKVDRMQTITHPDLCLDLRSDLLNIYLLTPLGLQICSSGICDSTFRYDWSSSGDLNLNFIATDRIRILTSLRFVILVSSSIEGKCWVDFMEKPSLASLYSRIVHTVLRCNSISIRTNLLTYLHAQSHLSLSRQEGDEGREDVSRITDEGPEEILKRVTVMLCKQLLQKKQTNVITNGKIDKTIKHLLDISMCDLTELMRRHLSAPLGRNPLGEVGGKTSGADDFSTEIHENNNNSSSLEDSNGYRTEPFEHDDEVEQPIDIDYELIKIHLRHAKFSQPLLDYLSENSFDENLSRRLIDLMFEHNPRLLIKCAQRYPLKRDRRRELQLAGSFSMLLLLVDKMKQLLEFDSTGINRASVLFTLAILYNALDERSKCLDVLDQIKPLNHLAITMSSNYELSHSIARVVHERYPDVFKLFLGQLAKRDKEASREFASLVSTDQQAQAQDPLSSFRVHSFGGRLEVNGTKRTTRYDSTQAKANTSEKEEEGAKINPPNIDFLDESACFDMIKDLGGVMPGNVEAESAETRRIGGQLVELLDQTTNTADSTQAQPQAESRRIHRIHRAYLEATMSLLESQLVLARLRENSH